MSEEENWWDEFLSSAKQESVRQTHGREALVLFGTSISIVPDDGHLPTSDEEHF